MDESLVHTRHENLVIRKDKVEGGGINIKLEDYTKKMGHVGEAVLGALKRKRANDFLEPPPKKKVPLAQRIEEKLNAIKRDRRYSLHPF